MRDQTPDKKTRYIRDLFAPEDQALQTIRRSLEEGPLPAIQIGADEGRILQFLVQVIQAERIAEIGTLAGYSTIWLARGLTDGGHLHTIEKEKEHADVARRNFALAGVEDRITLYEGAASEMLVEVAGAGPFDLVFIDADKPGYAAYLDWAEQHVRKGGLIIGDNTFLFDTVYEEKIPAGADVSRTAHDSMRAFNRRLADPGKYVSILLPTQEGMTIAQKLF